MILLELFWAWFQVGLFSIGGGYAALPIIQNMMVEQHGWLTAVQFADLIVIDELAPGPIILNSATFVGAQVAGFPGAAISTLGCIAGPAILLSIVAFFYFRFQELSVIKHILRVLRPVVVALIASAGLSIFLLTFFGEAGASFGPGNIDLIAAGISVVAFALLRKFKLNPVFMMLGCGLLGGIIYHIF